MPNNLEKFFNEEYLRQNALPYIKPALPRGGGIEISQEQHPLMRNLENGLLVLYLVDIGDSFRYLQVKDLIGTGLNENDIYQSSISNLRRIASFRMSVESYEGVFAVFLDGNLESSLILLDELWDRQFASFAGKNIFMTIPARDILAFCDGTYEEGIATLRKIGEKVSAGDHLITPNLFKRDKSKWYIVNE